MPKGRARLVVGAAVFATALVIAVLRVTTLSGLFGVRLAMPKALNDFKAAVYCPTVVFVNGGNPYDRNQLLRACPARVYCRVSAVEPGGPPPEQPGNPQDCVTSDVFPLYLPATLILHAPLALLPIDAAALVYFILTVVLSIVVVWVGLRFAGGSAESGEVLLGAGLLLLSRPGQWNLLLGQVALELTLATYIALYAARRSPALSGFALAVAAYKPTFGFPLAALMAARGNGPALLWGAGFGIALNLPPTLLLVGRAGGLGPFVDNLTQTQAASQGINNQATRVFGIDLPGLLTRWMGDWIGAAPYIVVSVLVLGIAAKAIRSLPASPRGPEANLLVSVVCVSILLSIHHNAYDLVLLVAPAVFLVRGSLPAIPQLRARRQVLLILIGVMGLNYVTTLSVLHRLEGNRPLWLVLASLNGVLLLLAFSIYVAWALGLSRGAALGAQITGRSAADVRQTE